MRTETIFALPLLVLLLPFQTASSQLVSTNGTISATLILKNTSSDTYNSWDIVSGNITGIDNKNIVGHISNDYLNPDPMESDNYVFYGNATGSHPSIDFNGKFIFGSKDQNTDTTWFNPNTSIIHIADTDYQLVKGSLIHDTTGDNNDVLRFNAEPCLTPCP